MGFLLQSFLNMEGMAGGNRRSPRFCFAGSIAGLAQWRKSAAGVDGFVARVCVVAVFIDDITTAQVWVPFGIGCFNPAIVFGFLFFVHGTFLLLRNLHLASQWY
jgi:hypothetical protein